MAPVQKLGNVDTKKRTSQKVAFGIFTLLSYLVVVILFLILGFIIIQGGKVISWDFLTEAPADGMTAGGIFPAIVGTLYLVLGSSLISFPIGIMSGIYMNEYATNGKIIRFIRIMTNNLSGVPSVVFGLFGMSLFVVTLGWGDSIIAGSFTLALMSLPLIIRTTEEALKSIDDSFRHGSLALGATKERSIFCVMLPAAKSGILAAVVLGIGRAIGETMAVIMVAGNQARVPKGILKGVRTLTANIVMEMGYAEGLHREALIATGVVLFVFILIINLAFSIIKMRSEKE